MNAGHTSRSRGGKGLAIAAAKGAAAALFGAALAGCPKLGASESPSTGAAKPAMPPAPVLVTAVARRDVPVELRAIGRVEPLSTVEVKAQIGGQLEKAAFTEGEEVKKGDLLFSIDSRPFAAALKEAEARIEKDRAELRNAEADAKRYESLIEKKATSQESFDAAQTKAMAMRATLRANEAAAEMARLDLGFCAIRSPISGRTGGLNIHPGNLVKANDEKPMVTIYQIEPIEVAFAVPEQRLAEVKKGMERGAPKVRAFLPGQSEALAEGELSFIDAVVDAETGTIRMKARFANADRNLWPGLFVNVAVTLEQLPQAMVVPATAIQVGQRGPYAFVVKEDLSAEMRPVKPGLSIGSEMVVSEGLSAGERVIVDGHLRVIPGAKVEIKAPAGEKPVAGGEKPS